MKWQKNTGVMPCEGEKVVLVRLRNGEYRCAKASDWRWGMPEYGEWIITHYRLDWMPPFDYVEPKVWTVELGDGLDAHFYQHGEFRFSIINDADRMWQEVLTALNQMEERNGTE